MTRSGLRGSRVSDSLCRTRSLLEGGWVGVVGTGVNGGFDGEAEGSLVADVPWAFCACVILIRRWACVCVLVCVCVCAKKEVYVRAYAYIYIYMYVCIHVYIEHMHTYKNI